ncbi:hypothetical protein [Maritimibacter fusiformis]|uniref:Uncharacterized protein n=1 Tax=Maritimibacter fusiformis TaxID=2603819 RepID=A0A5D0RS02_9RHOB|nr:hypothetical protein [Maritimibacter fusiformis]TYB83478.1 hypothetical protein FVF75_00160 [Maritimibacter fusiformis]
MANYGQRRFGLELKQFILNIEDTWWEPSPDRDFAWNAFQIGKWITQHEEENSRSGGGHQKESQRYSILAKEAFRVLGTLWVDHQVLPEPEWLYELLADAPGSNFEASSVALFLREECRQFLIRRRDGQNPDIPTLADGERKQRRYRRRQDLPDPEKPAWATVNRNPPKKVQIPCRVTPEIRALIGNAADDEGISQARWLEEAIAEKLKSQGYNVSLAERKEVVTEQPAKKPKRTQRRAIPLPDASPGIAANRADKATTFRMGESLAAQIDKARGEELDRSAWMNRAIQSFMKDKGKLPKPDNVRDTMSEPVSLRFDKDFFPKVEAAASASGLTNSEWFRRVARWYLEQN